MSEKITIKNNIIIPGIGDDPRARELGEVLDVCSDEEIKKVVEEKEKREEKEVKEREEKEAKEREEKEAKEREEKKLKLMGDTDAILENLKENHVKIEEDKEMMGYKGKIVHIDLPAVGNFEGYKFDYFISDNLITKRDFEENLELGNKSYSMKDISELLQAMNEYMKELRGENDGYMDYEDKLRQREYHTSTSNAGNCLKSITGLDNWYWLNDKDIAGIKGSRAEWDCFCGCSFYLHDDAYFSAKLLLRLSE